MDAVFFPFPNREACEIIFKEDPCYGKIPDDKRRSSFDDVWNLGVTTADELWRTVVHPADMRTILRENGLILKEVDVDYVVGNTRYFCDYQSEKNIVTIYQKSVALWAQNNSMTYENGVQLIIAHELFHFYEWHKIGLASKRCLVPMLKFGKMELGTTGIASLSEVGANAFANEWYVLSTADGHMPVGEHQMGQDPEPPLPKEEPERSVKNILKRMISF